MKNTTPITVLPDLPNDRLVGTTPSTTTRCHNLCPDTHNPSVLVPVLNPPLARNIAPAGMSPYAIPPQVYDIIIECEQTPTISAPIPAMNLHGDYTRGSGPLDAADNRTLTTNLLAAYDLLALQAVEAACSIQPRLMAWRLIDIDGNIMTQSVPKLVCVPDHPFSTVSPLTFDITRDSGGNLSNLAPTSLTARTYTSYVILPDFHDVPDTVCRNIARLEVLATPPLHPVSFKEGASTRLNAADSTHASLTAYMPGTAIDMAPAANRRRTLIENALHHFDSLADVVYTVIRPVKPKDYRIYTVAMPYTPMPAVSIAAVQRIVSQPVAPLCDPIQAQCSAPNSFSAATSLASGDTLLMADITPRRFDGYLPDTYAVGRADNTAFRQLTVTRFADTGEVTVTHALTTDRCLPQRLSALIVSPHPDASAMTMRVATTDPPVLERTFPLTPDPSGRYSYCLSPDLLPHTLSPTDDDYVIPAAVAGRPRFPNLILTAPVGAPHCITGHCTVGSGTIHRITRTVGSSSAWDFARQHLLLWASDGVYSLSVNSSRNSMGATQLHPMGVARSDAVAPTPWAIYAALTDGSVCAVSGSRLTPVARAATADAIGYEPTRHELWMKPPDGATVTLVMPLPARSGHYTRSHPVVDTFSNTGQRLLATAPDGSVYDLSATPATADTSPVSIEFKARCPSRLRPHSRLRLMSWDLISADADLTASLLTDAGNPAHGSFLIMKCHTAGPIRAPITNRIAVRPLPWFDIALTGSCHTSTRIGPITLFGSD